MQLVDNDTFLKQLDQLFTKRSEKGSIWLTHKRLTHDGQDTTMKEQTDETSDTREYPCLVRVTDGRKTQFETHVLSSQLFKFQSAYGALLKSSMSTLRKRDKKREKSNFDKAAKRKARMTEQIKIDGSKRGSGRRKRQRQTKALLKQQESQQKYKERMEEARKKAEAVVVS